MPQPRDDGGLGAVLDRNAFRPCYGSTANGRGMAGNRMSQLLSEIGMGRMERQKCHDGLGEVFGVNCLCLLPPLCIGHFALGETLGRSLGLELGLDSLDRGC